MRPRLYSVVIDSREDEAAWLAARMGMVTASDTAAAMGLHRWSDPLKLYLEKTGQRAPFEGNDKTEMGHEMEPVIARRYTQKTGRPVWRQGALLRSVESPWLGCTLDAITSLNRKRIPLELKNTEWGDDWEDGIPDEHWIQVQVQIYVTGSDVGHIAGLIRGWDFRWMEVERDDEFIAAMLGATRAFWWRVKNEEPPPSTDHALIGELYKGGNGAEALLDQDAVGWDEQIEAIGKQISALKAQQDIYKSMMAQAIGPHAAGRLPGNLGLWKWMTSKAGKRYLRRVKR